MKYKFKIGDTVRRTRGMPMLEKQLGHNRFSEGYEFKIKQRLKMNDTLNTYYDDHGSSHMENSLELVDDQKV